VSTILEALSKASREQIPRRAATRLVSDGSPYVPRGLDLQRRHIREALSHRWFWIGFGAAAGATVAVALVLAQMRAPAGWAEGNPGLAVAGVAASDFPAPADRKPDDAPSAPAVQSQPLVLPPNVEIPDEGLPHPFADVAPPSAPPAPVFEPQPAVVLPKETPGALAGMPALARSAPPPTANPARSAPAKAAFKPAAAPQPQPTPRFDVGGIIWDAENPIALINRQCVRQGDRIAGAEVIAIGPSSVVLSLNGKKIVIQN